MTEETETTDSESQRDPSDEGPGWMPAILAGTLLMGIIGFVVCAFSTWILFQKRTEFAIRTLRGSYIAEIEQSLLDPATKSAVVKEIETLAADMESGKYEDWQAAGVMQRLQRLPVLQWGELQAVDSFLQKSVAQGQADGELIQTEPQALAAGPEANTNQSARPEASAYGSQKSTLSPATADGQLADERRQLSRLRRAVELGKSTSFQFEDVLQPVRLSGPSGHRLVQPLTRELVREVVLRARLAADQAKIPDQDFDNVRIESIVRREIEIGLREGSF